MPPKQKPRLSCKSTASARSQHTHSEQSDEEQQGLLAAQHQHDASRRQHETLKQRQSRQAANEAGTASAGLEVEESREHREERSSSDSQQDGKSLSVDAPTFVCPSPSKQETVPASFARGCSLLSFWLSLFRHLASGFLLLSFIYFI